MTAFTRKSFSVAAGASQQYRDHWESTFRGAKPEPTREPTREHLSRFTSIDSETGVVTCDDSKCWCRTPER